MGGEGRVAFWGYIISLLGCHVQLSLLVAAFCCWECSLFHFVVLGGSFFITIIWDERHAKYSHLFWFFICFGLFLEAGWWGVTLFILTGMIWPHTPTGSWRVYVKKLPSAIKS